MNTEKEDIVQRLARIIAVLLILSGIVLATVSVSIASSEVATTSIVKFEGTIQARPTGKVGTWTIDGNAVEVVESTMIFEDQGKASVGIWVTVIANKMTDGTLQALIIRVQGEATAEIAFHVTGYVSEVQATYIILNGQRIAYDEETVIEGDLKAGVFVAARVRMTPSARKALYIHVVDWPDKCVRQIIGRVEKIMGDIWIIDGHEIIINAETIVHGSIQVGAVVRIKLPCVDGSMVAIEIEMMPAFESEKVQIHGSIQKHASLLIGEWVVGGQSFWVTPMTKIEGYPEIGRMARVEARRMPTDNLIATHIVIEGSEPELERFTGTIRAYTPIPGGIWKVDNRWVLVPVTAEIVGIPTLGAEIVVIGRIYKGGDVFIAVRIEVIPKPVTPVTPVPPPPATPVAPLPPPPVTPDPSETGEARLHMIGYITEVGQDYIVVNHKIIKYDAQTKIEGELVVGRLAFIMARITPEGYIATDITVVEGVLPRGDGIDAARALQRSAPVLPQQ
jgi:hypothetical protein